MLGPILTAVRVCLVTVAEPVFGSGKHFLVSFSEEKKKGMPATFRVLAYIPFFKKKTKDERFPLTDSSVFSVIQCTAEPTALVYVPASVKKPAVRSANCYGCMAVVIE